MAFFWGDGNKDSPFGASASKACLGDGGKELCSLELYKSSPACAGANAMKRIC